MATLQELLGTRNLVDRVQQIKPGLARDLLPDAFYNTTRRCDGNYGTYDRIIGERRAARTGRYGAPSQMQETHGTSVVPVTLLHAPEHVRLNPNVLLNLKQEDNDAKQKKGIQELARALADQKQRFDNLRTLAIQSALVQGSINAAITGQLQMSSTSALTSVDYGIPAGNKNQLNCLGDGPILSASWATAATSIQTQLRNLKAAARRLTGFPLKHAFFGINVMTYLLNNTEYSTYFRHNSAAQDALKRGVIPDMVADLEWHPMGEAFYVAEGVPTAPSAFPVPATKGSALETGSPTALWDPDTVVFTPEVDSSWWEVLQGTYLAPDGQWQGRDATEILDSLVEVEGLGAYAEMTTDPIALKCVMFDTFLPVVKCPSAIFIGKVKF